MIEKRIGCGQVEDLIEEAQDELKLIGHMNEWKPWGIPDDYECEVIENDAPVPKQIPLHRPKASTWCICYEGSHFHESYISFKMFSGVRLLRE
ncbi:putative NADH dehydrogenase [ubiquinone] 1 alpha subcomplex subunit 5, mitochondrial [Capsicum baccatum]|uniref:NADH dehydrogenase [ubiquinone] 1 alpha subcomplex subunit 5, mitochondrial n=1 Tax=Capsicum baccatum TaxID=33114 RepID=A0A2G2WIW6_CAPBA|nr:putative NADH dehydrogenase [ubiquinone] 1 alpha subcomplex subunit 5, mitochondrial [Capsicum baccatum]